MTQREIFPAIECEFSDCRRYRYVWMTAWDNDLPPCQFIGLNPSTADENGPDPTVRRCIAFAKAFGCGQLLMLNLFAFRATDPHEMKAAEDPVGPLHDDILKALSELTAHSRGLIIAAWGTHGGYLDRASRVRELLKGVPLHYLKLTKDGCPGHPLYLKGDLKPVRWV